MKLLFGGGAFPEACRAAHLSTCSASTPETWAKFTQDNLLRAERERLASVNLRALVDCILQDTSEDLRLQCDTVNLAFQRRCEELEDALHKLEHHLRKVRPRHNPARPRPHTKATPTTPQALRPATPTGTKTTPTPVPLIRSRPHPHSRAHCS